MILDQIVADSRQEVEARKHGITPEELKKAALTLRQTKDFAKALKGDKIKLIAEVKKASPSKGVIREVFDPEDIAWTYAKNGAAAISVLTEQRYFQGNLNYLKDIRDLLGDARPPLLRKDFIFDPYQVYESRTLGADAILLIVAILTPEKLNELLNLSHELGMKCLVEVHNENEVKIALKSGAEIIGINNRDLNTFKTDINTTKKLRPLVPGDKIVVSESGIKDRQDIEKLRQWGADAVLIGETLMAAPDIAAKMKELL